MKKVLVAIVAIVVMASLGANAQSGGSGAIQGMIKDGTGAYIPDATVTARNVATGVTVTRQTSKEGFFMLPSLNAGTYTVTVTAAGFESLQQQNIRLDAMQVLGLDLTLQVGAASQTVTVTEAPPVLHTEDAMLGSTVEQEMYSSLPVLQTSFQRRATDFIQLMPGVNAQPTNGDASTNVGSVNGSSPRGAVSSIYINGVPITSVAGEGDPRFIWTAMPLDSINQFQVYTAAYPAAYEGQGVINYDVKGGTNKIHGNVFEYFRNTALDTWGYLAPAAINPKTGTATKPVEHQNEYGFTLGFPILKDKLFIFGSYSGYRYVAGANYQYQVGPTLANLQGDFTKTGFDIYDPTTTVCSGKACKRTQFVGDNGTKNILPSSRISAQAKAMQAFLQKLYPNGPTSVDASVDPQTGATIESGKYLTGLPTGKRTWSTANRVDYHISPQHNFSAVIAFGRLASSGAGGGISGTVPSSKNQMAPPFISYQQYFDKTKVLLFEDDYTFTPHILNQLKYGYGRYDDSATNQDQGGNYSASALGITGLPNGQASDSFPKVSWSGNGNNFNQWAGYSGNRNVASGYVLIDNLLLNIGRHNIVVGGEIAWMQYNFLNNKTGVNPLQLTFSSSETSNFKTNSTSVNSAAGYSYASFLLGATDSASFTLSAAPETGARFRPVSPYIQDDWKITPKLAINLGLRWDYYPSYREVKDRLSWMDPNVTNTLVNYPGALVFAGSGSGRCNCHNNVNNYLKNFGPRLGIAYQIAPKTVLRASYGVFYTHGNNIGGSATSRQGTGLVGYSVSPKAAVANGQTYTNDTGATGASYWSLGRPFPSYTLPPTLDSTLGTYYTTASSAASQSVSYADPYYGGRAPQYINWSFGIERQLTVDSTFSMTYVGSEGHFVYLDSNNGRGKWSNQLDPKYLYLGNALSQTATSAALSAAGISAPFSTFSSSTGTIAQALKPFPQYSGVSDSYGAVGNTSYHSLQLVFNHRLSKGLSAMANYTWSRSIDSTGSFRSGYDIPAAYATDGKFHKARSLDRSLSMGNQPHKFVVTAVYDLPFGKGHMGGNNFWVRNLAGGWHLSGIYRIWAGSPLSVTMSSCNTNPAQSICYPILNSSFGGPVRINGEYGHARGANASNMTSFAYIDGKAFAKTGDYVFSTLARSAPLNLRNSGSYTADMSVRRSFDIRERAKFEFKVDAFNITNHTWFGYGTGGSSIGWNPTTSTMSATLGVENASRDFQLSGNIRF